MRNKSLRFTGRRLAAVAAALFVTGSPAFAQFIVHPSLGVQSLWFNGDVPASQDISPGNDRTLPLGGGIKGTNPGGRLQIELIPDPNGMFRIPVSVEAFMLDGRTTFAASDPSDPRRKRLTFKNTATVISAGAGLTLSFFKLPSLYVSVEGRVNYIGPTTFSATEYYMDNGEQISYNDVHPDSTGQTRIGAFIRVGTQVDFFDPFLLDFNIGYGALNVIGKVTDPAKQRNLLVVDTERHDPETTLGYIGVGLSLIWQL